MLSFLSACSNVWDEIGVCVCERWRARQSLGVPGPCCLRRCTSVVLIAISHCRQQWLVRRYAPWVLVAEHGRECHTRSCFFSGDGGGSYQVVMAYMCARAQALPMLWSCCMCYVQLLGQLNRCMTVDTYMHAHIRTCLPCCEVAATMCAALLVRQHSSARRCIRTGVYMQRCSNTPKLLHDPSSNADLE